MSDLGSDERFDAFLRREVAEYNRPPGEVPREEMWEAVARARATRRTTGGGGIPFTPRRQPLRYAPWIGMAATLLLGVGLGRYALQRDAGPTRPGVEIAASAPTPEAPVSSGGDSAEPVTVESPATPPRVEMGSPVRNVATRTATTLAAVTGPAAPAQGASSAYAVASREHLSRAEALVAVVAAMPADPMMDSLMGLWARDVLTNTRLLLDSPAGADPIRRRLLEDLETLLVQLVQRSGRSAEERDLIDRTLQRTQLLTRLRSSATGT